VNRALQKGDPKLPRSHHSHAIKRTGYLNDGVGSR
jgi:hypothetical protein